VPRRIDVLRPVARALALLLLAGCSSAPAPNPPTVVLAAIPPEPSPAPAGVASAASSARSKKELTPIAWVDSEPTARARARREGLPLLIWVRAGWEAASLEMERRIWTEPVVIEAARPFVALRLDVTETEGDSERYAERYAVSMVPTTILFAPGGRRVETLTGLRDPAALAAALRAASAP
jgi:thiol:disulfide interchange protein